MYCTRLSHGCYVWLRYLLIISGSFHILKMLFLFQSWEMVLGSLKKYTMVGVYHTHNPSEIDTTYSFWWLVGSLLSLQVIAACGYSWDWDSPPSTKPNRHPFLTSGPHRVCLRTVLCIGAAGVSNLGDGRDWLFPRRFGSRATLGKPGAEKPKHMGRDSLKNRRRSSCCGNFMKFLVFLYFFFGWQVFSILFILEF